ncbi:UDP-2,3-diacylglucosamine diphosphatase [Pseudomaricurvus alcaniphilus]|uniref:UDP-2,3-diacylglucosamine diphosphatase n=1 Tax=Pseudomaricurvus alcaniphilus TaxID=1166482 RepID=UPI00140A30EA|nr:UDP-2,3-diacylglucosamine diphosphatase [Pseudomaricurvus alcaniphilus]NHN37808.1 UDP-2,3-diacylglucosamine diphosphatase [Pseudomaricurvus alcaniphilus]
MEKHRTLWISDVHLGTKDCKADLLNDFLKQNRAEKIYLVGDIVDGWNMKTGVYWRRDFNRVLRRLLTLSKRGVQIDYITGNHDEFLRRFANNRFDNIHLLNRALHTTADGRRLLVIHGDQFDGLTRCHQWLKFFGDRGNALLMLLNRAYNALRAKYGYGYWSLAGYIKTHIPRAKTYIQDYEESVAKAAQKQGFDGVVCGHIHHPASKRIGGVDYYNTGDWVDSCSAIAEDFDGNMRLLCWQQRATRPLDAIDTSIDEIEDMLAPIPVPVTGKTSIAAAAANQSADAELERKAPAMIMPL